MMLTVHGLPNKTKFQDVKDLIKQECNIPDFILDNLVDDGFNAKKVRIGLTNEDDGYRLMKCLEGFRMSGSHVLKVVPVGKPLAQPQNFDTRSSYSNQPRNDYPNQSQSDYSSHDYNASHSSSHARSSHDARGLMDARQSLSQAMADSRHQDRYQPRSDIGQGDRSDFRDSSRGPLVPSAIRPTSMDSRGFDSRGPRQSIHDQSASVRGPDGSVGYQPVDQRVVPEATNINQWNSGGGDWSTQRVNQNPGYNYQQPQTTVYGQQASMALTATYAQARVPQAQTYQQPKPAAPPSTRAHVLRSVQLVDAPITPRAPLAFPPAQKPVTIMKDNFQGPTQYNVTGQTQPVAYQNQGQGTQSSWQQGQTKQLAYDKSYDERRLALEKRNEKPQTQDYNKRRFSPTRNTRNSPGRSPTRKAPVNTTRSGQNYPERRVSPTRPFTDRRVSPSRHITSTSNDFTTSGRRISPSKISPTERRVSPTRKLSPGRRVSPGRRHLPGRRVSPTNRRISPFARKASPPSGKPSQIGRRVSPGKHISPQRRISPSATGRRISPFGRKASPNRHLSPNRRVSPARRASPNRRVSPGRRGSPRRSVSPSKRGSPSRRNEPRGRNESSMTSYDYYLEDERRMGGRPESPRRYSPKRSPPRGSGRYSPSESKYDSDMPNSKGTKPVRPAYEANQAQKYTGAGFRAIETQYPAPARNEPKIPVWQNDKITYPTKKDERDAPRRIDPENKLSPRSRSRSPIKDRYRRHSPSPRSPRRSWALEKRRSPETIREPPPPPLWPGQEEDNPKHPVWEISDSDDDRFDDKRRNDGKYVPRFSPRRDDRREYRDGKFERDYRTEDRAEYRRGSPREDEKKLFKDVDKDFNDIYQRAVEFRRKTEELRKSNDRRNMSYDEEEEEMPWRDVPAHERTEKPKPNWIPIKIQTKDVESSSRSKFHLEPAVKEKRDKAVEEIANRILEPHSFTGDQRHRVMEELKLSIYNIMLEMFKDNDVSYIELVIKFRARYDAKDEEKILQDALTNMPNHYKNLLKRKGAGTTEVPAKISRRSPAYVREGSSRPKLADAVIPDWNMAIAPPTVLNLPINTPVAPIINTAPVMVQPSVYVPPYQVPQHMYQQSFSNIQKLQANLQTHMQTNIQEQIQSKLQEQLHTKLQEHLQKNIQKQMQSLHQDMSQPNMQPMSSQSDLQPNDPTNIEIDDSDDGCYNLYLCQDDFEPFSDNQAQKLKRFIVSEMFKASETGDGWAPVFTLKGLNSMYRYELSTRDEASKNWIINLDFSDFDFFNVLVYTKEELWYERAAIWLPGHSRYRNLEPLEKLRLQNRYVEGINIGKWKFVKKIVTLKGTRLYVDMPPSSARALEKQKMMLSYELGKVNVYLKAVAVDKEVFDAGLKAHSISDPSVLATAMMNNVMSTLPTQQIGLVKVTLKGAKSITIQQAGKIKEMIIYDIFKYHQQDGRTKTDFLKYGFCPPNCIGIEPENSESKRWLMGRSFGKLNRQNIVVLDGDDVVTKYFRMRASVPLLKYPFALQNTQVTMERLRTSNQGVKGLNFSYWKPVSLSQERGKGIFEVDVDLESTETLMKLHFKLDYVDEHGERTIIFKSDYSVTKLDEKIRKYKAELLDSYDVANMELDSDSG